MLKMNKALILLAATGSVATTTTAMAAPYASNVSITGTNVSFTLNESGSTLSYAINGGPAQTLDGTAKGTKSFTLSSPTDTFSITASKADTTGYRIGTGASVAAVATGLSQSTRQSGFRLISEDSNPLVRFNSPRGVSVNNNPQLANFGTAYLSNSAAGNTAGVVRAVGDGLYAVRADQSDAFGYGNTAQDPGSFYDGAGSSASSPFRLTVSDAGEIYGADFSDANGNIYRANANLTLGAQVFAGVGGPTALPANQNHGSTTAVYVEGSQAAGNLVVYTLDEDLRSSQFGGPVGDDRNSLWRYDIGSGALPSTVVPTKVNAANVLLPTATSDLDRGADGKFYLAQSRSNGGEAGIIVLNTDGTVAFDSLTASRTLLGNPAAVDIFRNSQGIAVSEDQQFLAVVINNSDIGIIPLVNGLPDIANRLIVDTGTDVISGRDIAFDAVGNIHYVSSGQALYRVLSPGGEQMSTLSFDGTNFSFSSTNVIPEPTSLAALAMGGLLLRRRR